VIREHLVFALRQRLVLQADRRYNSISRLARNDLLMERADRRFRYALGACRKIDNVILSVQLCLYERAYGLSFLLECGLPGKCLHGNGKREASVYLVETLDCSRVNRGSADGNPVSAIELFLGSFAVILEFR